MSENEDKALDNEKPESNEDNSEKEVPVIDSDVKSFGKWGKYIKKGNDNTYKFDSEDEIKDINGVVVSNGSSYRRIRKKDTSKDIVTLELIVEERIQFRKEDFEQNFGIKREKVERKQRGISLTDAENTVQKEKLTPLVRDEHYLKILQSFPIDDIKSALNKLAEQKTS